MLKLSPDHERRVSTPGSPVQRNVRKTSLLQQTYLPLLIATTMTSALFCYLYITSASIPSSSIEELQRALAQKETPDESEEAEPMVKPKKEEESWLPRGDKLPTSSSTADSESGSAKKTDNMVDADAPIIAQEGFYEPTNQKVGYSLIAELGDGQLQKINATLPAAYRSRLLSINAEDRRKAELIFSRLTQLHKNMGILQREANLLLNEWNGIIVRSTPYEVLRSDSPSLHGTNQEIPASRIEVVENQPETEPAPPVKKAKEVALPPDDASPSATVDLR